MRFGAPWELVSDRGKHFINEVIANIIMQHQIRHRLTTPYNPKANGLTEKANGLVCAILKKIIEAHKTDWDRKLQSAVYAYNTTVKGTTGKSPYFLVYGQDPLTPVEQEIRTIVTLDDPVPLKEEFLEERLGLIENLEVERTYALERTERIQERRKKRYDKRIHSEPVHEGDEVLLYDSRHQKFPGKLHISWMGPFKVLEVFGNGSLQLATLEGEPLPTRTNGARVRKFHDIREYFKEY
jgi:hypothetical protein